MFTLAYILVCYFVGQIQFNVYFYSQISVLFDRTAPVQMLLLFTDKCVSW